MNLTSKRVENKAIPRALACMALAFALGGFGAAPALADGVETVEIYGNNRYETSRQALIQFSEDAEAAGRTVDYVIVASGENYPDALSASGLAGVLEAPVLLCATSELSEATGDALILADPVNVIIVGGTSSISSGVESQIDDLLPNAEVLRLDGSGRAQTAEKIYSFGVEDWSDTAILVSGSGFADALSASAYSYAACSPIFLVEPSGSMSLVTEYRLTSGVFDRVVIVGGENSVSAEVQTSLEDAGVQVERWAGENRYETSAYMALKAIDEGVLSLDQVGIAAGGNFPDALSASSVVGQRSGVMLLASSDTGGLTAIDALIDGSSQLSAVMFFGGPSSVPQTIRDYVATLIG